MSDEKMPGTPDPEGEYFAQMTFGRRAKDGETEDKVYLDLKYPNLPYGAMVTVQKLMAEEFAPALVAMGELMAETVGHPVIGLEEIKTELEKVKKGRGQGPAKR